MTYILIKYLLNETVQQNRFLSNRHIIHRKTQHDNLNKILAKNTGKSTEQVEKDSDRDNYMTADEAKKYGIIDKVIVSRKDAK